MQMKKWFVTTLVLVLGSTLVSIAYAAHTTINTDNGSLDSNWGNVSILADDGDDFGNDNYDINQGWIANEADNSAFYFRVNLVGNGQLPHDYSSFEARLDCNRNGSFQESADVVVYYAIDGSTEELVECQGDEYPQCDFTGGSNNSDTNGANFGEEILGTPNNYEWRADVNNGDTDWSNCLGQINVQFASLDSSFVTQETTTWQGYNVPTAVEITKFGNQPRRNLSSPAVIGSAIIILLAGSLFFKKLLSATPHIRDADR